MLLIRIFAYLPFPVLYSLSNFMAWLLNSVVKYRRKVIDDNLRHAFPAKSAKEIRQLRKEFYRNFTDLWLEALKGLELSEKEYRKRVKLINPELPLKYFNQGRAVMVLSSHRSGWEWLTPSNSLILNVPIDAVYQNVKSRFFNQLMANIRSRFGARMVETHELLRDCIQRTNIPRLLAIMYDQSPHFNKVKNCHWVPFMNRLSPFYTASEKLARKLDMPIVYADMERVSRGHYTVIYRFITDDPRSMPENAITEKYVNLIEDGIRRNPADYLWSHRRWKHSAPAEMEQAKQTG